MKIVAFLRGEWTLQDSPRSPMPVKLLDIRVPAVVHVTATLAVALVSDAPRPLQPRPSILCLKLKRQPPQAWVPWAWFSQVQAGPQRRREGGSSLPPTVLDPQQ